MIFANPVHQRKYATSNVRKHKSKKKSQAQSKVKVKIIIFQNKIKTKTHPQIVQLPTFFVTRERNEPALHFASVQEARRVGSFTHSGALTAMPLLYVMTASGYSRGDEMTPP